MGFPKGICVAINGSSTPKVMRAGVVGAGAFGRHHASKYSKIDGVELVGVADPNGDARRAAATAHGVASFADWRSLIGKVDIVSVCSPAVTHAPIVRAFLNAGVDVLVEKPIATSLDEADALIALAESKNRVLTVGHQERYVFARTGLLNYPDSPLSVECWRMGPWTGRGADVSAVLDLMIHDLDLVHRLIQAPVVDVQAKGRTLHGRFADEVTAEVQFENGAVARLTASRISPIRRRGMRAIYSDGAIEFDFVTREVRNSTRRALSAPTLDDPLGASVQGFVNAARAGSMSLVRPEEARAALETALLIEDAAESTARERGASEEFALQA